jgi:preprotein translocase subunit Sec63
MRRFLAAILTFALLFAPTLASPRAVIPRKAPRAPLPAGFDPYFSLRALRGATAKEVRSAYRRALNVMGRSAAKGGHGQQASAEDARLMEDIKLAYEVLSDDAWRAEWDAAHPPSSDPTPLPEWDKERDL